MKKYVSTATKITSNALENALLVVLPIKSTNLNTSRNAMRRYQGVARCATRRGEPDLAWTYDDHVDSSSNVSPPQLFEWM